MKVFKKKILADFKKDESFKPVSGVLSRWSTYLSFSDKPNRNTRLYDKGFWEEIVKQPMFQEKVATKTLFGELDHPFIEERMDTVNPDRVSHSIVDVVVDDVGIKGVLEVLDTPCGRILDTFLRYGSKIGVSTRGVGEEYPRPGDGYLVPDRSTYQFITWDAVLTPAFDECRPEALKDSLSRPRNVLFDGMQKMSPVEKKEVLTTLGFVRGSSREVRSGSDVLKSYKKAGEALQKIVDSLTQQLSVAESTKSRFSKEVKILKDQLRILSRRQEELEKIDILNDELQSRNDELQSRNDELQSRNDELQSQNVELRSLVKELRKERVKLIEEKNSLVDSNRKANLKIKELERRAKALFDKMNESERYSPIIAESRGGDSGTDILNLVKQRGNSR